MIAQVLSGELRFGELFALNGQLLVQLFLDERFFLWAKMLGEKVDDQIDPLLDQKLRRHVTHWFELLSGSVLCCRNQIAELVSRAYILLSFLVLWSALDHLFPLLFRHGLVSDPMPSHLWDEVGEVFGLWLDAALCSRAAGHALETIEDCLVHIPLLLHFLELPLKWVTVIDPVVIIAVLLVLLTFDDRLSRSLLLLTSLSGARSFSHGSHLLLLFMEARRIRFDIDLGWLYRSNWRGHVCGKQGQVWWGQFYVGWDHDRTASLHWVVEVENVRDGWSSVIHRFVDGDAFWRLWYLVVDRGLLLDWGHFG